MNKSMFFLRDFLIFQLFSIILFIAVFFILSNLLNLGIKGPLWLISVSYMLSFPHLTAKLLLRYKIEIKEHRIVMLFIENFNSPILIFIHMIIILLCFISGSLLFLSFYGDVSVLTGLVSFVVYLVCMLIMIVLSIIIYKKKSI